MKNDRGLLMAAMAGLGRLLPGDVIHDKAPVSLHRQSEADAMAQLAAARAKRERKAAKAKR